VREAHVQREVLRQPGGRLILRRASAATALTLALAAAPPAYAASGRLGIYADGPTALGAGPGGRTIVSVFASCAVRRRAAVAYSLLATHRVTAGGRFAFAEAVRIRGSRVTVRVRGRFTRKGSEADGTITAHAKRFTCRRVLFRAHYLGISQGE
jgi:hypothetical protein